MRRHRSSLVAGYLPCANRLRTSASRFSRGPLAEGERGVELRAPGKRPSHLVASHDLRRKPPPEGVLRYSRNAEFRSVGIFLFDLHRMSNARCVRERCSCHAESSPVCPVPLMKSRHHSLLSFRLGLPAAQNRSATASQQLVFVHQQGTWYRTAECSTTLPANQKLPAAELL